ncbi:MAG: glutamate synthase subunit beta [Candidatus Omnitrophica bacterium]|nr:glutamate synthase subunit beta [Candidatus Omnitrophota bacterium]
MEAKRFLVVQRETSQYRPVCERVLDFNDVTILRPVNVSRDQASRCLNCGTPFCHWACPLGNYIPEWNKALFKGNWRKAFELLDVTNLLPEITGRVCPAPCEYSCVLGINDDPITIRENELAIIEYAFEKRIIKPHLPTKRTGKKVAVVGSGPAGLSCAAQLNNAGHRVTVFERDAKNGGLLRYGIPDFKLEKWVIDRRLTLMKKEGVVFKTGVDVGNDYPTKKLLQEFDAICLAGGSRVPRDLNIGSRSLNGIHFAMDYLAPVNKRIAGESIARRSFIDAKGKKVVVIGGGDTGSDCVGTANRQGAACVVQLEVMPQPPKCRTEDYPWPRFPLLLKTTSSHEEGADRHWTILTKEFIGEGGRVKKIKCVRVQFPRSDAKGCPVMRDIPGTEFEIEADLVILAIGFVHPEHKGLIKALGIKLDSRGNVETDKDFMSSRKGIFAAGDMRRGQSLVVWAIAEGRHAAHSIDAYLMGESNLAFM